MYIRIPFFRIHFSICPVMKWSVKLLRWDPPRSVTKVSRSSRLGNLGSSSGGSLLLWCWEQSSRASYFNITSKQMLFIGCETLKINCARRAVLFYVFSYTKKLQHIPDMIGIHMGRRDHCLPSINTCMTIDAMSNGQYRRHYNAYTIEGIDDRQEYISHV